MLEQEGDERVVIERQDHHLESKPFGNVRPIAPCVARSEKMDGRAGHERGADEGVGAGFFIVTVDEGDSRPNSAQRHARGLGLSRKMRRVSGEFDGSPQERGGEGIGRKNQDVVTAHVAIDGEVCILAGDE